MQEHSSFVVARKKFQVWPRFPRISQASTRFSRIWAISERQNQLSETSIWVVQGWGIVWNLGWELPKPNHELSSLQKILLESEEVSQNWP